MKSSWAGALGQPQFLPTSFLKHAVDFDGDGVADIWNSTPDTLASIANYLVDYGWVKGRDWGFEVTVPDSVSCALEGPDQGKRISDWAALGIARIGGKPFPKSELKAEGFLLMPAGRSGPAFIVTPNFYVLKEYNESDLYALFIGHGADRIAGGDRTFAGKWGKVGGLYRSDVAAMQRGLEKLGYDVGGADGLPGFKTRRSIGDWQAKNGQAPTCFPNAGVVKALTVATPPSTVRDWPRPGFRRISPRALWSKTCAVTISSSAPVRRTKSSRPLAHRRRRADDGAGKRAAPASPLAIGSSVASKFSTGGGSLPGRPVRKFTKACCSEVNSSRASASVSAAKTFRPSITVGFASRSEGWKRDR